MMTPADSLRLIRFRDALNERWDISVHLVAMLDALAYDDLEAAQHAAVAFMREYEW